MQRGCGWVRIFQPSMYPCILIFIHPIHRHFQPKFVFQSHPKPWAAAQVNRVRQVAPGSRVYIRLIEWGE